MAGFFGKLLGINDSAEPEPVPAAFRTPELSPEMLLQARKAAVSDSFPPMKNTRILRAARGQKVDKLPVWIMRQVGRYLPEFRDYRKKYTFVQLYKDPVLCATVSLMPIERFALDTATIFTDWLGVTTALGLKHEQISDLGPVYEQPIKDVADLARLRHVNAAVDLKYVMDAMNYIRYSLNGRVPVLGYSGAPWSLMAFCIEGRPSGTWSKAKKWLLTEPEGSHELLHKLEEAIVDFLVELTKAGAQILQFFEPYVQFLTEDMFLKYVKPGYIRMTKAMHEKLGRKCPPLILWPKDAHFILPHLRDCGFDVVGVGWRIDLNEARRMLGPKITIQGNLDPCALYADDDHLRRLATEMVEGFEKHRYIVSLGENIYYDTDPDKVAVFVDAIHSC